MVKHFYLLLVTAVFLSACTLFKVSERSTVPAKLHLNQDDISLVASGDGFSKEEAVKSALRSALEQTYGTFVSSNTTILNDQLIKDEIVSVSSGNIRSYNIISENMVGEKWSVVVQAVVSIGRLVTYVKSKGAEAELTGEHFAMNMKIKELARKNTNIALEHLYTQLSEMCLNSNLFDYSIEVSEPRMGPWVTSDKYVVWVTIFAKANHNIEAFKKLLNSTLQYLSMSQEEVIEYDVFNVPYYEYYLVESSPTKKTYNGPVFSYIIKDTIYLKADADVFFDKLGKCMVSNIYSFEFTDGLGVEHTYKCIDRDRSDYYDNYEFSIGNNGFKKSRSWKIKSNSGELFHFDPVIEDNSSYWNNYHFRRFVIYNEHSYASNEHTYASHCQNFYGFPSKTHYNLHYGPLLQYSFRYSLDDLSKIKRFTVTPIDPGSR